ncbi:MAG: hypothetical protein PWP48_1059 [Clostridiales bacterium]|nr:hypothetical protein [Clostridiales bacterium]
MKGHYIADVMEDSLAKLYDIKPGEVILTINGMPIEDVLDYRFLIADERIELEIKGKDGFVRNIIIEKDYDEDLGLVFDNPLMDKERVCRNRCIFCFVDQLPKGVRPTLKYKDDDWRLSFLDGNYITLTNLTEHDIDRITKMHISPLYVSIHAVDPKVRSFMLGIPETDNIVNILQRFKEHNIMVHGQMVLCPGINDGHVLDDSIKRLMELWPSLQSLAVVPVGLTEHRQMLYPLRLYEQHTAVSVLSQIEKWQSLCFDRLGTRWVFAADELYLIAQRHWPPYESYEDFPQLENGVGLLAMFEKQFYKGLEKYKSDAHTKVRLSVATGLSAADFMQKLSRKLADDYGIDINVYPIKNNYFGKTVTVAGLVVGRDIIEQLRNVDLGDALLIPKCMLREGETVFLDDTTLDEVQQALNTRIRVVDVDGEAFLREVMKYR